MLIGDLQAKPAMLARPFRLINNTTSVGRDAMNPSPSDNSNAQPNSCCSVHIARASFGRDMECSLSRRMLCYGLD